ncbi:uncharacterized protein mtus1b isoform X2 [Rhinoraja longicauda]
MSLQANNCNGMDDSSHGPVNSAHQPNLINDTNDKHSCARTSRKTVHVVTQLTIEKCMIPDKRMFPCNNNARAILSDQEVCGLPDVARPESEVADDHLCDEVTNSQTSSSDKYITANLSCNSESSATITDPGWCVQTRKLSNSLKSKLPCIEPLGASHATDFVHKLNSNVSNEVYLQKTVHHVLGNSLNFDKICNTNNTSIGIKTRIESSEYPILPCESQLEMKGVCLGSTEYESTVSLPELSVFSNSSYDPIVVSDQSLDVFESVGDCELTDDLLTTYQLPMEVVFDSKDPLEGLSNQQPVVDEKDQVLCQVELGQRARFSIGPSQNPNWNVKENTDRGKFSSTDDRCVTYQPKEMVHVQLVATNEQTTKVTTLQRDEAEAFRKPFNSAMNATFIVLQEANNSNSTSEIVNWNGDAEEPVPQARDKNEETFLISNSIIREDGNTYSQTSTPLPESTGMIFFSTLNMNPTGRMDGNCTTPVGESPINLQLQPNTRDPVQKQCYKIKHNAIMKAKVEIKCYPKPNFNNVKPKVVSRVQTNSPQKNVSPSSESSSKNVPRSVSSIPSPRSSVSSIPSPCSLSFPKALTEDRLSKSAPKVKSAVLKLQNVYEKVLPTNKQHVSIAEKISKTNCKNALAPTPSKLALIDGPSSQVHNSLQYSLSTTQLNKTFHYNGSGRTNLSKQRVLIIEKPRARCSSLAIDHRVGLNVPASVPIVEKAPNTEVILTKSAPSDQVGRKPSLSNKRSLPMPSQSAKLRVPSSESKLPLGSMKNHNHLGGVQCPINNQLMESDEHKVASNNTKPRLGSIKATPNLGGKTVKGTLNSKLPVPTSGLKRVNSLSSNSSGVSVQSVRSTCSSKATVTSVHRGGDGSRERVRSAYANHIQKQSFSVIKNKSASVKSTCKGSWRNVNTPSQVHSVSVPRSARQLTASSKLKADKTWVKSNSTQKAGSQTNLSTHPLDLRSVEKRPPGLLHYKATCEKQVASIARLKEQLKTSNQRCEAIATVVQYLQVQKEEVDKQRKELSHELLALHSELETRNSTYAQLEKDREELQKKYEGVIQKLSEEHRNELKDLEQKLEQLFNAEKEHLQQNFKQDVETLQVHLQKEVDSFTSEHEAHKVELVATHANNLESLEKDYQQSLAELTRSHEVEQMALEESFTERQSLFEEQIAKLNEEKDSLKEEIKTKEIAKAQMQKDQKVDPVGLFLEQELESLKAVLEIKNEKIHNQEKRLMQMERLMEKHVVLDEKHKIVLQENEDLKARMDKHKAVSRQLSTEQVVLQTSLQKESKVNKRLSMENEELLWKLQNGEVLSPQKLSPSSSFPFQSSRNSTPSFFGPSPSPR